MGCTSSHFLEDDEDYLATTSSGLGHHIVSLTSTTYGLLNLDSSPQCTITPDHQTPKTPPKLGLNALSLFPSPLPERRCEPEIINSWELMAGLDNDSFRFSPKPLRPSLLHNTFGSDLYPPFPRTPSKPSIFNNAIIGKENREIRPSGISPRIVSNVLRPLNSNLPRKKASLDGFEKRCPPGGENAVVIYTTTLRGIRKTFEACNAVRAALEGVGVWVKERDVSMHSGYREELKELMKGSAAAAGTATVPRLFIKGRYIGGAEEVLRIHEEGGLAALVEGLPKARAGAVCDGCGGGRFLPCFGCNGSCKLVKEDGRKVVRCPDCNENGLILCPVCS